MNKINYFILKKPGEKIYNSMDEKATKWLEKRIHVSWLEIFRGAEIHIDLYKGIARILNTYKHVDKDGYRYRVAQGGKRVHLYPRSWRILSVFRHTPFDKTKVIMIGQDPYFKRDLATGLAFGVRETLPGDAWPPSLKIIKEEVVNYRTDMYGDEPISFTEKLRAAAHHISPNNSAYREHLSNLLDRKYEDHKEFYSTLPFDHTMRSWAKQGVLMLNSSLTVEEGKPKSHNSIWHDIIGAILNEVATHNQEIILVNMGGEARILTNRYFLDLPIVNVFHPAYDARTGKHKFRHSAVFKSVNDMLISRAESPIIW